MLTATFPLAILVLASHGLRGQHLLRSSQDMNSAGISVLGSNSLGAPDQGSELLLDVFARLLWTCNPAAGWQGLGTCRSLTFPLDGLICNFARSQPTMVNDSDPPKRPKSSYLHFAADRRSVYSGLPQREIAKRIGEDWRALPAEAKQTYQDVADAEMSAWRVAMAEFQETDAHAAYSKRKRYKKPHDLKQMLAHEPKRPLNSFLRFAQANRNEVKANNPDIKLADLSRIFSKMWSEAPAAVKKRYSDEADAAQVKYSEEMAAYKQSDEYLAYESAKSHGTSFYRTIGGKRYDRALLQMVAVFAADGQVGYPEAKKLWQEASHGKGVTEIKKDTLKYAMENYKFTEKAASFTKTYLNAGTHTSFYKVINGVKYDRHLLEEAEIAAADGQVSWKEAKQLFADAQDGTGLTGTEKDTLDYALKTLKFTDKARAYLAEQLEQPHPKSYYKIIDGVKYDQALLLECQDAAKDGLVSEAEAKRLWRDACDGAGVTAIEKQTLKYALKTLTFSDSAKAFLESRFTFWKAAQALHPH